jgi:uncharacterized protein (TIGR02145 family)
MLGLKNEKPSCEITSPEFGAIFPQGTIVTISVDALDNDGNIDEVRFFIDGTGISSKTNFPYNYLWDTEDVSVGIHSIRATAIDDEGESTSDELDITISEPSEFTDPRDGQTYQLVKIGEQTWMAENLRYAAIGSTCYDDDPMNCETYGRLYVFDVAITACPAGYHLPSRSEWQALISALGGEDVAGGAMKETGTIHWDSPNTGATNSSGFTALPGGFHNMAIGYFAGLGEDAEFITSTETSGGGAMYAFELRHDFADIIEQTYNQEQGLSVRCVKN